jgi:hypothetical protein
VNKCVCEENSNRSLHHFRKGKISKKRDVALDREDRPKADAGFCDHRRCPFLAGIKTMNSVI